MYESNDPGGPTRRGRSALALALMAVLLALVVGGLPRRRRRRRDEGKSGGASSGAEPIRIAFSTWNGYIGIVIGVKEGLFEKAGVKVDYTVVEDPVQRFNALKSGSLDAIATTPDTFSRTYANGIETVQVLGLDASVGGDGIVAEKSIGSPGRPEGQGGRRQRRVDEPVVPRLRARPERPLAERRRSRST